MTFREKYYKYKAKYTKLKNSLPIQTGSKIFEKKQILYIVATISQSKLKKATKQVTNTILGPDVKPYRAPHITLFHLIINAHNEDNVIFQNKKFYNSVASFYAETIGDYSDPLILQALPVPHDFSFTGYRPRHFIKNYKPMDRHQILDFRQKIFDWITNMLGEPVVEDRTDVTGATYHVHSFGGQELFAESTYYDIWKPHINFLNEFDIQKHNAKLYEELGQYRYGIGKVTVLKDFIRDVPQKIYQDINMATQMRNLTYAVDKMQKKFKI